MLSFYLLMLDDESEKYRFEQIYNKYESMMAKIAMAILKDEDAAAEATSNAFVAICKNIKCFPSSGDEKHERYYVQVVIRNHAINVKHQKENRIIFASDNVVSPHDFVSLADEIAENDIVDKIVRYIDTMPEGYRDVLVMKYVYDMKVREIAAVLKYPENTVRSKIRRGISRIQQYVAEEGLI